MTTPYETRPDSLREDNRCYNSQHDNTMNTQPRRKVDKRRKVLLDKRREGNRYKTRQDKTRQAKTRVGVKLVYGKGCVQQLF